MNPGLCASSEMQITLQVLSINFRAWASCWSCRENRSLAPINFNGIWTPNSLSLFENQNHSFFRNIRGQVKCLVLQQTVRFLQHWLQQSWELSPRHWGVFLVPSTGFREGAGSDVWILEVWAGSSTDTRRNPPRVLW